MDIDMNKEHWEHGKCPKYNCRKDACKCGLRKVFLASVLGDDSKDSPIAPKNGEYCNAIVAYEANGNIYIYSQEGIPTLVEKSTKNIEESVDRLDKGLAKEILDRQAADGVLQGEIDAIKNSPDVVDIVATYAALQAYDTSNLGDNDIIRVLSDETHGGASTYYRYSKSADSFEYVGEFSGGAFKKLTKADYNYDFEGSGENDCIALWRLPTGYYYIAPAESDEDYVNVVADSEWELDFNSEGLFFVYLQEAEDPEENSSHVFTIGANGSIKEIVAHGEGILDYVNSVPYEDENDPFVSYSALNSQIDYARGQAKVLGTEDYNWPTNNPDGVALWNRAAGVYSVSPGTKIYISNSTVRDASDNKGKIYLIPQNYRPSGQTYWFKDIIEFRDNEIYSYSTRVYDGALSSSTKVSSPTIVQTTGNSQTSVMSQDAVTQALANAGGAVHALTSADNNYDPWNTGTNQNVAAWLLPSGWYTTYDNNGSSHFFIAELTQGVPIISPHSLVGVKISSNGTTARIFAINMESQDIIITEVYTSTGFLVDENSVWYFNPRDLEGLTNQIDEIWNMAPWADSGAPDSSFWGTLGQLYTDIDTMHTYQCTAIDETDPDNPTYTWTQRW